MSRGDVTAFSQRGGKSCDTCHSGLTEVGFQYKPANTEV